jgi:hypothetical protein
MQARIIGDRQARHGPGIGFQADVPVALLAWPHQADPMAAFAQPPHHAGGGHGHPVDLRRIGFGDEQEAQGFQAAGSGRVRPALRQDRVRPFAGVDPGFLAESGPGHGVVQQIDQCAAKAGGIVRGDAAAAPGLEDVGGAHDRERHHRTALGHGFQQHQALGFRARGEHEGVGRRVGGGEFAAAIHVAEKADMVAQPEPRGLAFQVGRAGPSPVTRNSRSGRFRRASATASSRKADVLFMRHPPDEQHHRHLRRDALAARKRGPSPGRRRRPAVPWATCVGW